MTCHMLALTTHVVAAPHGFAYMLVPQRSYIFQVSSKFTSFGAPGGRNLPFPVTSGIGFNNSLYYHTRHDQ